MAGDQRPGRGHADEHGLGPAANAGARLLAERGVRLVADHNRVSVGDAVGVAHEPLVGLDRDRAIGMVRAVHERRRETVLVAAIGDLADELVDEVAPVGEDQHAAGSRRLNEPKRGNRLAGARGVLEPEPATCPRILGRLGDHVGGRLLPVQGLLLVRRQRLVLLGDRFGPVPALVALELGDGRRRAVAGELGLGATGPVPALACRVLELGGERGEGAGEHVDLMLGELGPVAQEDRLGVEQTFQPEQQRVLAPPLR